MARVNWQEELNLNEEQINSLRFVAYTYLRMGKYDIAETFFKALFLIDRNNIYDLQMLGAIYLQKNNNAQALNLLDKALKVAPNHYPSLLNKAKALFGLGYKKEGFDEVEKLISCEDAEIRDQASALKELYQ